MTCKPTRAAATTTTPISVRSTRGSCWKKLAITTPEETDVICAAIWHHDGKAEVDGPMDEILKDADVIDHSLFDPTKEVKAHEVAWYAKLRQELGLAK